MGTLSGGVKRKVPEEPREQRAHDWSERAVAWVERSCAEQGVPVKLTDPVALDKIAEILLAGREERRSGER